MTVYLGQPRGGFVKNATYALPEEQEISTRPVLLGDFNGDGNFVEQSFSFKIGTGFDASHILAVTGALAAGPATAPAIAYDAFANPNLHPGVLALISLPLSGTYGETAASISPGGTLPFLLTLASQSGYSGVFNAFACTGLPPGASCTFAQPSLSLVPGGDADTAFSIQTSPGTPLGNYTVAVTAGNGVLFSSVNIGLGVGDLSFSLNPTTVVFNSAAAPSTIATVTFVEGNNNAVTFACNGLPPGVLGSGGSAFAIAPQTTISVGGAAPLPAAADYPFTITGSGGAAAHTGNAVLRVENFSATLDYTTGTLSPGQSTTFAVALSSHNHFANSDMQVICQSALVNCSTNPASAVLTDGGNTSLILTVTVKAAAASLLPSREQPLSPSPSRILAALLLPFGWTISRRSKRLLLAACGLMILCCFGACGGTSATPSTPPSSPPPGTGTGGGSSATIAVPVYGSTLINASVLQNSAGVLTITLMN